MKAADSSYSGNCEIVVGNKI